MVHNFDTEIAERYGLLESILLNHLYYWIEKNRANNANYFDGTYWTYNSTRAFNELFPYVSERQIKNALKHLREEGIVLTGNYNKSTYDRTLWYALSKKGQSIVQKCPMEEPQEDNGTCENVPPIPDIIPDNKPDIEPDSISSGSEEPAPEETEADPVLPVITLQLNTGEEYPISQNDISLWEELYPVVDVLQELRKMKGWLLSHPKKRKTKRGIKAFITTWLAKEQDKGGGSNRPYGNRPARTSQMTTEQYAESIRGWNQ